MKKRDFILGLPKTILLNFRYFDLKTAIKLPVWVSRRVKFKSMKGKIVLTGRIHPGMVRMGLSGSGTAYFTPVVIENNGTMILGSDTIFGGLPDMYDTPGKCIFRR